jgi:molybdopterin converting factor small subunit
MTITVKLFAILREKAGIGQIPLELPQGATIESALAALIQRRPELSPWMGRAACALNLARADRSAALSDGDELALLPPVSGG